MLAQLRGLTLLYLAYTVFYNVMLRLLSLLLLPLTVYNMVQAEPGPPSDESRLLRMPPDRLFCVGPLPDFKYGNTYLSGTVGDFLDVIACGDVEWSRLNFTDLSDLCAAHGNPAANMGGRVKTYSWTLISLDFLSADYLLSSVCPYHLS